MAQAPVVGDVGHPVTGDARSRDQLGVVALDDACAHGVAQQFAQLDGGVVTRRVHRRRAAGTGLLACGLGRRHRDEPRHRPPELMRRVHQDVGGDAPGAAGQRVVPDPVVHGRDGGRGPLVGVAERPPAACQRARVRQEELEQHAGGEPVAVDGSRHQCQQHAVGVGGLRTPDEPLDVAGCVGVAGELADAP